MAVEDDFSVRWREGAVLLWDRLSQMSQCILTNGFFEHLDALLPVWHAEILDLRRCGYGDFI
jgi:hypothetical protein